MVMLVYMRKFLVGVVMMGCLFLAEEVRADMLNPEFGVKKCAEGEKEVICHYSSKVPFGPKIEDECGRYVNDPRYYYLVSTGSSFGGREKYCLKVGEKVNIFVEWRQILGQWWRGVYDSLTIGCGNIICNLDKLILK